MKRSEDKLLVVCAYDDCDSIRQYSHGYDLTTDEKTITYEIECLDCRRPWVMSIRLDI